AAASCMPSSRPSTRSTACSVATALRACWYVPTGCCKRIPTRVSRRSVTACQGIFAGAPVTRTSLRRCRRRPPSVPPPPPGPEGQSGGNTMADSAELREREQKLQGLGSAMLRREDARFIRGQGTYIDDIKLPGMLFGAIVRSPYAHARITAINKTQALASPGVVAVLTAEDLKPVKLHWMPTAGGDVAAGPAGGKGGV